MSQKRPFHVVPPEGPDRSRRWLRVLIADDDRDAANMLAEILRAEGNEVHVSLRGDDALDACRLFRPDVVIVDVNMPGASGYAIARELRERNKNVAPLLIAISGVWTKTTDRLLGEAVGFDHYLLKPYDPREIVRLIEPLRSGEAQVGGSAA